MDLSIIIPVYNAELYLKRCLMSIVGQDFKAFDYEVIVVDDGSIDESLTIAREMAVRNPRIRVFSQENRGQAAARNYGLSKAAGEWVCFVDADDYWIDGSIGNVVDVAKNNDCEIVGFDVCDGNSLPIDTVCTGRVEASCSGMAFFEKRFVISQVWIYFFRRDFLERNKIAFVEGYFVEDAMFLMTALLAAKSVAYVDKKVYCYCPNSGSTMIRQDEAHQRRMIESYEYCIDYLTRLIARYKSQMTVGCYGKCIDRRNSFIFFLLIRVLRYKQPCAYSKAVVERLRGKGLYPFARLGKHYPAVPYLFVHFVLNHSALYYSACGLYKFFI